MSTASLASITSGSFTSPKEYFEARERLVNAERDLSFRAGLEETALEQRASKIVQDLKSWEEKNLHTSHADGTGFEAAHKFLNGVSHFEDSKLLAIARKAPKGCLLHCHFDAILPPDGMFSDARENDRLYISSDVPLTSKGFFEHALPLLEVLQDSEAVSPSEATDLFSKSYAARSWMKYSAFLAAFPGGPKRAEEWLKKKIVLTSDQSYHPEQTVNGIWKEFIRSVMVIRGFLSYETAYRRQFQRILWKFAEDGIQYAEIRVALNHGFYFTSDDGTEKYGQRRALEIFQQVLQEEVPKIQAKGYDFIGVKVIYAVMRFATKDAMEWVINNCIEMKQEFPDLICGFDLQGQEDSGYTHSHWIPELLAMRARCDELELDLPFIFHAGETHDHGGETDSNLFDAILLGTKRIGHGFAITKHPLLMQICKERGIAVETCPISNEVLGLCGSVKEHHLPLLLSNCVPCTVSSDDPGCWQASVLSHDFYQAFVGSNNMGLLGWRKVIEWSIQYSCMNDKEREKVSRDFKAKWTEFCQWIVATHSG